MSTLKLLLWELLRGSQQALTLTGLGHYGVYLSSDHTKPLDYLAGMAVINTEGIPEGVEIRVIPAAQYALFSCQFRDIGATYGFIWDSWLNTSAYEHDITKLGFDYFPPGMSESSTMQIWLPVKPKAIGEIER